MVKAQHCVLSLSTELLTLGALGRKVILLVGMCITMAAHTQASLRICWHFKSDCLVLALQWSVDLVGV
jgi:hypothetical protein